MGSGSQVHRFTGSMRNELLDGAVSEDHMEEESEEASMLGSWRVWVAILAAFLLLWRTWGWMGL
jgi:hypothetical protein